MLINIFRTPTKSVAICVVQLEVDFSVLWMVIILMPTEEKTSFRLDPANPVEVVVSADLDIKADFNSGTFRRIAGILEELSRVRFCCDSIRSRLSMS